VLNDALAHASHPVFSKLFVQTEFVREKRTILARRRAACRRRGASLMFHALLERPRLRDQPRAFLLGRDSGPAAPRALTTSAP
jgi:hypothetical protein